MSVLIKGMEMPEGCLAFDPDKACPCFNSEYGECAIVRKEREYGEDGRPSWCPLVEVKTPHGRLIKGEEMPEKCEECWFFDTTRDENFCKLTGAAYNMEEHCPLQPLVRCENCKYCRKVDESEYWCYGFCSPARLVRKDDFCSHGCKKE